uniref:Uncharacterized protein n=1 Tax=Pyrodinium bahamense TaxID=73915 RepID=A0A7S0B5G7_9DINO|mmetsp:Transcript_51046/g.141351  ORF Transcript_51046/g.141351 Transcript_51046/m.141351 type:complete len:216 (+) Transcript_51046:71-718(+)
MLPLSRVQVGRDYMEFFTVVVWATVILIMFLAKLKAMQDVLIAIILIIIMAICNADSLLANFHFYKVFVVFRWALLRDCICAVFLTLGWLGVHGAWPEARAPGILLHLSALAPWVLCGVQSSPVVSCGLWAGGRNQMTKIQLMLRILAQVTGTILAFAVFGLYYSFRFPGEGPFRHFFGLESVCSAGVTFVASVLHIRALDRETIGRLKDPAKLR